MFLTDRLVPVVAAESVLAGKTRVAARRFLAQPVILREAGSGTREVVERAFARAGLTVRPTLVLASTEAIKRAVMAGLGVAVVSALAVETELATGQLATTTLTGVTFHRPLQRVEVKGRHPSPAVVAFREVVAAFAAARSAKRA